MSQGLAEFGRRLRVGMVGGGSDSVIGETHRIALRVDGLYELVAGALSIDPQIAAASAKAALLDDDRSYEDYRRMAAAEAQREDGIDVVVIATPPGTHLEIAREFLSHGIHVACEKPMTRDADEAALLLDAVGESERKFLLTHCYTGYPMVREARALVRSGALGKVRLVEVAFAGGDPGVAREAADPSQRHWRFRASSMGPAAILGEVGSHAHNISEYVTGDRVTSVSARLDTIAERREVYDNAYLNVEYAGGAVGRLWSSYVAIGNEHGLSLRVFGDEASVSWDQERPEALWLRKLGGPAIELTRASDGLSEASLRSVRFRPGHPEGYALAFANLYRDFAMELLGGEPTDLLPTVRDGMSTMQLIRAAEESHDDGGSPRNVDQTLTG